MGRFEPQIQPESAGLAESLTDGSREEEQGRRESKGVKDKG